MHQYAQQAKSDKPRWSTTQTIPNQSPWVSHRQRFEICSAKIAHISLSIYVLTQPCGCVKPTLVWANPDLECGEIKVWENKDCTIGLEYPVNYFDIRWRLYCIPDGPSVCRIHTQEGKLDPLHSRTILRYTPNDTWPPFSDLIWYNIFKPHSNKLFTLLWNDILTHRSFQLNLFHDRLITFNIKKSHIPRTKDLQQNFDAFPRGQSELELNQSKPNIFNTNVTSCREFIQKTITNLDVVNKGFGDRC